MGVDIKSAMGFGDLKSFVLRLAGDDLKKRNPGYVDSFVVLANKGEVSTEELKDLESQLTGDELQDWYNIHAAIMRVESCRDKVRTSLHLFSKSPPLQYLESLGVDEGRWMTQHSDSWLINLHARLERFQDLGKLVIRRFVKPRSPDGLKAEQDFTSEIDKLLAVTAPRRDRPGHGLEYFEALEEENLWVPYVLFEGQVDLVSAMYSEVTKYRQKWATGFRDTSIKALAQIEAQSDKLLAFLPVSK